MNKPRRRARPLPPPQGPSGQRFGITVVEYTVGSWCESPDGTGPATSVGLQLITTVPDLSFVLKLKSPAAVDEMVAALQRHKADVWPDPEAN